jgi:serine/threonine protein kinase
VDLVGEQIGPYRLLSLLGQGGTAEVYKALQTTLDRHVAVKVLLREVSRDPEWVQRFRQEARLLGQLDHPNVLPIYDAGEYRDRPFLVMKYVAEGVTLRSHLRGEPWPIERVVHVIEQVAEALNAAHEAGVVHRDVKPSNILVTPDSRCLVFDFGIAKPIRRVKTLTGEDFVVGTPEFMSPEQCRGEKVDHRSDVYALGIMTYQMLTGRVPFTAETPIGVLMKHLTEPLPLPPENVALSPELNQVLQRVLARSAGDRFPSVLDYEQALQKAAGVTPTITVVAKTVKQSFWKKYSHQLQGLSSEIQQLPGRFETISRRLAGLSRRGLALAGTAILAVLLGTVLVGSRTFSSQPVVKPSTLEGLVLREPSHRELPPMPVSTEAGARRSEKRGFLRVKSDHPAAVFVDGQLIGTAPGEFRVEPGEHLVKLDAGDDGSMTKDVKVFEGQTTYVSWNPQ